LIILLGVQKAPHLIKYRVLSASSPRCGFFYKKILIFALPKKKTMFKSAGKNINRTRNVFSFISAVENTCMYPDK